MSYFEQSVPGPGTHALIIGIGRYHHLPGGAGTPYPDPSLFPGLGQLTSPPLSAVAVAEWLVKAPHQLWTAPLASVELLVSAGADAVTADPTLANIKTAYRAWRTRARARPDNVALFYFCGHGLQSDARRLLLTSDFGVDEENPFTGAFNLEGTRAARVAEGPDTQCFFVDSCASPAPWFAMHERPAVAGLGTPPARRTGMAAANTVTILASRPYGEAEAPRGQISYFTQALLAALGGGAATRRGTDWVVSTADLFESMSLLLADARPDGGQALLQDGLAGDAELWRLAERPPVEFAVRCIPDAAHRIARLACSPFRPPGVRYERMVPRPAPWLVRSVAGSHLMEADFPDECYPPVREQMDVLPRTATVRLRVTP